MKPPVIIAIVVIVIIVAGGAWYAYSNPAFAAMLGFKPAPMTQASPTASSTNPSGRGFGGNRGGFATGSIETLNGNAFIITLSNGTTKNVTITATTTLENYVTASSTPTMITPAQLSVGEQVTVMGSPNADGSINATRVLTGTLPIRSVGGTAGGYGPHTTTGIQNGANGGQVLPVPQPN
jgi:hypothetical protein